MTPQQIHYKAMGERTVEALKKRSFDAWYCEDKQAALKKALELIPKGASVTWGGTHSIYEMGLADALLGGNYDVLDRSVAKDAEEKKEIYRKSFCCDWYLGSANAISLGGEIINIDGTGNRVAAMIYGPDNVLLIVGANKLAPDSESALKRARNTAAPVNAASFGLDTPCSQTGSCMDCLKDNCICNYITLTRHCKPAGRIKVIIVGEDLGY